MRGIFIAAVCASLFAFAQASQAERYDLSRLPIDLRPVIDFIGLWEIESRTGTPREFTPPDLIDLAINMVPKFGARSLNISHTYLDANKNVVRHEYGFMPVKNATRRDPRVHVGYLTTSSEGFSMMEQGVAKGNKITFHLKQFLRRTFNVGSNGAELDIREFERQLELRDPRHMTMRIQAETSSGTEGSEANYRKILP